MPGKKSQALAVSAPFCQRRSMGALLLIARRAGVGLKLDPSARPRGQPPLLRLAILERAATAPRTVC